MWLGSRDPACERPEASEMTQWIRIPVSEPDSLGSILKFYSVERIGFCKLSSSLCVDIACPAFHTKEVNVPCFIERKEKMKG